MNESKTFIYLLSSFHARPKIIDRYNYVKHKYSHLIRGGLWKWWWLCRVFKEPFSHTYLFLSFQEKLTRTNFFRFQTDFLFFVLAKLCFFFSLSFLIQDNPEQNFICFLPFSPLLCAGCKNKNMIFTYCVSAGQCLLIHVVVLAALVVSVTKLKKT